jgi:hypothetical protein
MAMEVVLMWHPISSARPYIVVSPVLTVLVLLCAFPAMGDGLIFQLPPDGVEAEFRGEEEFRSKWVVPKEIADQLAAQGRLEEKGKATAVVTVRSVGRVTRAQQECRWIEVQRRSARQAKQGNVLKMLIPERYLKRGEDPLDHAVLTFFNPKPIDQKGGPREQGFNRLQYEIDRFRPVFPEPLSEARELTRRAIETPAGKFEGCWIMGGKTEFDRPLLNQGRWTFETQWEIALHSDAPFGVVQTHSRSKGVEIGGNDFDAHQVIELESTLTLSRVGKGSRSVLPEDGLNRQTHEKGRSANAGIPERSR